MASSMPAPTVHGLLLLCEFESDTMSCGGHRAHPRATGMSCRITSAVGSPRLIPSRRELAIDPLDDQPVDPALATDTIRRKPTLARKGWAQWSRGIECRYEDLEV